MSTRQINEIHSLLLLSILEFAQYPGQADKMIMKLPLTCFAINARHEEIEERTEGFNSEPISRTSYILLSMGRFFEFQKSIILNQYRQSIKKFSYIFTYDQILTIKIWLYFYIRSYINHNLFNDL